MVGSEYCRPPARTVVLLPAPTVMFRQKGIRPRLA